jgi:hypothetical protein
MRVTALSKFFEISKHIRSLVFIAFWKDPLDISLCRPSVSSITFEPWRFMSSTIPRWKVLEKKMYKTLAMLGWVNSRGRRCEKPRLTLRFEISPVKNALCTSLRESFSTCIIFLKENKFSFEMLVPFMSRASAF